MVDQADTSLWGPTDACGRPICSWCEKRVRKRRYPGDMMFCGRICRQAAWRIRRLRTVEEENKLPIRCAYADPPFPHKAFLYKNEKTYKGEVDHAKLIASLVDDYDGWALSTGAYALREVLPHCPAEARVCAWTKPHGASVQTFGIHNCWEPLIVMPGRSLRGGKRDWLAARTAQLGGSNLIGRKPEAFVVWMFELLGMLPGDTLDDLFPGSGIVGRAWREVCRGK